MEFVISHSTLPICAQKRFPPNLTIGALKDKLYLIVGTKPAAQRLQLRDSSNAVVAELSDDNLPLSAFPIAPEMTIHVIDTDPSSSQTLASLTDNASIPKFEISEEAYSKRPDSFRNFKKNFLSKQAKTSSAAGAASHCPAVVALLSSSSSSTSSASSSDAPSAAGSSASASIAPSINIQAGQRCQTKDQLKQRGVVKYVGPIGSRGVMIGVRLDEPMGNSDGSVNGHRCFVCESKQGAFYLPDRIEVGDFPERDIDQEL